MAKNTKSTKKRVKVESLPTAEKELINKEAKKVKGGMRVNGGWGNDSVAIRTGRGDDSVSSFVETSTSSSASVTCS